MTPSIPIERFYRVFRDVSTSVHSSTSVKEALDTVVQKTTQALEAKGAILRILNLDTHHLELCAAHGLSEQYLAKGPVSSQQIITDLCRLNRVIIIEDMISDPRVQYPQAAEREGIRMMLDLPLTLGNHFIGILRIFFPQKRPFSDEELNFVVSIGEQISLAIEKARLIETKQAQYDQLAIHTEKLSALGRMAAGIAHEINNPLAGILLYSSNLIKKVPPEGKVKEGLEVIIRETIRCKSIIQELLEFSRDREPQKKLSNLNAILAKALSILENEFRLRHIRVEKELAGDIKDTCLDENQIEQVFVNLLLNSVQAMEDGGLITIQSRFDRLQDRLKVVISDTGCGIPEESIPKIFEPFFSTKPKGTGLGLAVSYGIIRNHGGSIQVDSRLGRGSRFTLELPIQQHPSPSGECRNENRTA